MSIREPGNLLEHSSDIEKGMIRIETSRKMEEKSERGDSKIGSTLCKETFIFKS